MAKREYCFSALSLRWSVGVVKAMLVNLLIESRGNCRFPFRLNVHLMWLKLKCRALQTHWVKCINSIRSRDQNIQMSLPRQFSCLWATCQAGHRWGQCGWGGALPLTPRPYICHKWQVEVLAWGVAWGSVLCQGGVGWGVWLGRVGGQGGAGYDGVGYPGICAWG